MQRKALTDEELDRLLAVHMPKANALLDSLEEERYKDMAPHIFSEDYKKNMKRIMKEYSMTSKQRKFKIFRKYAAAVLVIFILINGFLIVTVEAYRAKIYKIITTIYNTHTSIITETDDSPINENPEFSEPSYIPDGFEVINQSSSDISRIIDYANGDRIIVFKQSIIANSELGIDTEDTKMEELEIDKYNIKYVFNKGMYNAYWFDNEYRYLITGEISFEELVKIIESIIQK